jgi:hypothetical protein
VKGDTDERYRIRHVPKEILAFEQDRLSGPESLELFGELVASGRAWTLPGHYGREAHRLIEEGWLSESGEVLEYPPGEE